MVADLLGGGISLVPFLVCGVGKSSAAVHKCATK
jgi:hypothetical protein